MLNMKYEEILISDKKEVNIIMLVFNTNDFNALHKIKESFIKQFFKNGINQVIITNRMEYLKGTEGDSIIYIK